MRLASAFLSLSEGRVGVDGIGDDGNEGLSSLTIAVVVMLPKTDTYRRCYCGVFKDNK